MAGEQPTSGMVSISLGLARRHGGGGPWAPDSASTMVVSSALEESERLRQIFVGALRSEARIAVIDVFWALITMIGRSGRTFLMRGRGDRRRSRRGITTSVMTRSPSPWLTHRHSVAAFPVERTSYPARDRAWFNTVRIAASSSAINMLPANICITSAGFAARLGVVTREFGHENTEDGPSRLRLAFDDAAMITDDLGGEREAKPAPGGLGGHEGIEQVRHQVLGHARAVVLDAELERQRDIARLAARQGQPARQARTRSTAGFRRRRRSRQRSPRRRS